MDYSFWLGKPVPVEYDIFPCPPDYILVDAPKADEYPLENSPLYTGVGLPK